MKLILPDVLRTIYILVITSIPLVTAVVLWQVFDLNFLIVMLLNIVTDPLLSTDQLYTMNLSFAGVAITFAHVLIALFGMIITPRLIKRTMKKSFQIKGSSVIDEAFAASKENCAELVEKYDEIRDELRAAVNHIAKLSEMVDAQTCKIEKQRHQLLKCIYHNGHQVRGPLARIMGVVDLFEKNAVHREEKDYLYAQLKLCALELDREIKKTNAILNKDLEYPNSSHDA